MEDSAIPTTTKRTWRNKLRTNFRIFLVCVLVVAAFSVYWFYFNVKSNGDRKGILVKFSHKGNVFKTDEGEMWLGCRQTVNVEKYYFSVTNDSIAAILKNLQDECMQLEYKEYRSTLPWRGDSRYIVYGVKKIESHLSQ